MKDNLYIKCTKELLDKFNNVDNLTLGIITKNNYSSLFSHDKEFPLKSNTQLLFLLISYNIDKLNEIKGFDVRDIFYTKFSSDLLDKIGELGDNLTHEDFGSLVREMLNVINQILEEE